MTEPLIPDFQIVEGRGEPITFTRYHSELLKPYTLKMMKQEGNIMYVIEEEIKKNKPTIHVTKVFNSDIPILHHLLSHESLHVALSRVGESEASKKLDLKHGSAAKLGYEGLRNPE